MDSLLRDELIRDEGLRLSAYKDTNGFWTIGVGHLLGGGLLPRMNNISMREATALLAVDVEDAEAAVKMVFGPIVVHPVRWRALVNMAFNRGQDAMQHSTTITPAIKAALAGAGWDLVTAAIGASPWAKQVGARATRLAFMLENCQVMP